MSRDIFVEHQLREIEFGGGYRIVLGQPEPRDGCILVPAEWFHDLSGTSLDVEILWRGDACFSMHNGDGDLWELPRGCDQWNLASALRDECAHLL